MRERDLDRHGALGAADVDDAAVILPGELGRDRLPGADADAGHRARELRQPLRVGVERREEVLAALGLVLRLAGAQALGQRPPEPVQPGVRHLQHAADVGRLGPVEEEVGRGVLA